MGLSEGSLIEPQMPPTTIARYVVVPGDSVEREVTDLSTDLLEQPLEVGGSAPPRLIPNMKGEVEASTNDVAKDGLKRSVP